MSRKLPEELVPVLAKLGHHWPEADEDGLRRAAGVWHEFGTEAQQLSKRGGDSAQRVTGENSGRAVDAFAEHWRGFAGAGRGQLDDAQSAAELLAKAFESAATAVDHCKTEIVAVLTPLAEELRTAEAAERPAAPATTADGLIGSAVKAVATAVTTAVTEVAEAAKVEAAKLRVGALLEELGREMKHGLETALKEPAVTTLERIARADGDGGPGGPGDITAMSGKNANGQFTGLLAGVGAGGGAALGGVRTLSAAVGPDGNVLMDRSGHPVLIGPDGKRVTGVEGVTVAIGEDGRPLIGADGKAMVLGEDGKPVTGIALGLDGRPLKDAAGEPVVVGADGKVGTSGISVAVGTDGKPLLGADGRPVLLAADGQPVLRPDQQGLRFGPDGKPVITTESAADPLGPRGAGGPPGLRTGPVGATVQLPVGPAPAADPYSGTGGGGDGGRGEAAPVPQYGGSGRHRPEPVQYSAPAAYDDSSADAPAPIRVGPVSLHTDSVAVAPQPTSPAGSGGSSGYGGYGDGQPTSSGGGGGGNVWHSDPPISGGLSGGGAAPGGFSTGPVSAPGGASPVATGPVGAPGAVGAPGTVGVPGAAGGQPGAAGAPGIPGASVAPGGTASPTAGGQSGVGVIGAVVPGQGAGAPVRTPTGTPLPGANIGQGGGAAPFRPFAENVELRRGPDGGAQTQPAWAAPVESSQVGVLFLVGRSHSRQSPVPPSEAAPVRTIADSRPYGAPGGLGPVDPAHQLEAERRAPRTPEGAVVPHPDPLVGDLAGDWADALNGGGHREPGRSNNCLDIALSAVDTFAGIPTCSAPRLPDGPAGERGGRDRAERELGTQFRDLGDGPDAMARLADVLLRSGHGSQAVLLTVDGFGRSHTWNAVNHRGSLSYLDHQLGRQSSTPLYSADHGLWAIATDAAVRPIDLTDIQLLSSAPASIPVDSTVPTGPVPAVEAAAEPVAPAPPRSRLNIHRAGAAKTSTRSAKR